MKNYIARKELYLSLLFTAFLLLWTINGSTQKVVSLEYSKALCHQNSFFGSMALSCTNSNSPPDQVNS